MSAEETRRGLTVVKVRARAEDFRIVQLQGNSFVCSRANGNCCCGWKEKGRMRFDNGLWGDEWERRKIRNKLHLTFTGCLGPCAVGNNALLQLHGRSIWFKDLNNAALAPLIFTYAESMLTAGRVLPPPKALKDHIYERYALPAAAEYVPLVDEGRVEADGLEGLDPVCLMEVDLQTARHTVHYKGQTVAFCAPSCKKLFLAGPEAYLVV